MFTSRPGSGLSNAAALFLSVGRFHIVMIAALGLFTFGWLFMGEYPWLLTAVCALDWYVVNLLNRVVDLPEDRVNEIAGTDFVARNRRALCTVGFALLLGSLAAVHLVNPAITPLRIAYHSLGIAYNWPLLPGKRRIKQLYFWKNTASAMGFMLTVFGYPLATIWSRDGFSAFPPGISLVTIAFAAGFFMLFELSYEVFYDLRDVEGDSREGVRTYPAVHGPAAAVRIIDGLIAASLAVLAAGYLAGPVPWRIFIMAAAPLLNLAFCKWALKREITSAHCIGLTWLGAALLLIYHVWIVLDLPGAGA